MTPKILLHTIKACMVIYFVASVYGQHREVSKKDGFYEGCDTVHKSCYGIGKRSDCISSQSCKYANAVFESSTDLRISFLYEPTNGEQTPCIFNVFSISHRFKKERCEGKLEKSGVKFLLLVDTQGCTKAVEGQSLYKELQMSKDYYKNHTCTDEMRHLDKNYLSFGKEEVGPPTLLLVNIPSCDRHHITAREISKVPGIHQYDGNFYTNIKSADSLSCSSGKHILVITLTVLSLLSIVIVSLLFYFKSTKCTKVNEFLQLKE